MAMARDRDHVIDLESLPAFDFKRAKSSFDIVTQRFQLLNMVEHLPTDVVLIGFRQALNFRYGAFQGFRHSTEYIMRAINTQGAWGASPAATGLSRAEPA